jgi:hypothetical protein
VNAKALTSALAVAVLGATVSSSAAIEFPSRDPTAAIPALQEYEATAQVLAEALDGEWSGVKNTKSMLPTLSARDLIVTRPVNIRELRVGDIIVFNVPARTLPNGQPSHNRKLVHRVIRRLDCRKRQPDGKAVADCHRVRTRGDNLKTPDRWSTTQANLESRVMFVIDGHTGTIRDMRASRKGTPVSLAEALQRAAPSDTSPRPLFAYAIRALAGD